MSCVLQIGARPGPPSLAAVDGILAELPRRLEAAGSTRVNLAAQALRDGGPVPPG